jgi:hypothetical protein
MNNRDYDIRNAFGDMTPVIISLDLLARAIADFRTSEAIEQQSISMTRELLDVLKHSIKPVTVNEPKSETDATLYAAGMQMREEISALDYALKSFMKIAAQYLAEIEELREANAKVSVALTDEQIIAAIRECGGHHDREWKALTYEAAPYEAAMPTAFTKSLTGLIRAFSAVPIRIAPYMFAPLRYAPPVQDGGAITPPVQAYTSSKRG